MAPRNGTVTMRDQFSGFPIWQMLILCLIRFSEPISFSSLFPYVYYMIRDFKISPTEEGISKYSGYLAGSFAFSQFLFAVQWGKLGDRKFGRKPILLFGLFGTSIAMILFGFSTNFYMALAARCLSGALNGNVGIVRTMISEIATERRHQPIAFSTLPLLFNLGSIIGPLIGGSHYLTRPSGRNPYHLDVSTSAGMNLESLRIYKFYDWFSTKYPYALSNIVVACILWFSLICGILFLEETHPKFKFNRDRGVELGDIILRKFGLTPPIRAWQQAIRGNSVEEENDEETPLIDNSTQSLAESSTDVTSIESKTETEKVIFTPRVLAVIASNFVISLHNSSSNEFIPVFLATRFKREGLQFPFKIEGGFGLSPSYIGNLISSTGIMGMIIVLTVFPLIDRKLGTINGFRLSVSIFPIVYFLVPLAIFTLPGYSPDTPTWVTPVFLYTLTSLKVLASATGMPQIMLLINRAADKNHRAYINGYSMSIIALARFIGPVVCGYLMSVGDIYSIGWLMWWTMAALSLYGMVQSFLMKDYEDDE